MPPSVKALSAVGLAKESTENTAVAPTVFVPVESESFDVTQETIKMTGVTANPMQLRQVQGGPLEVAGAMSAMARPQDIGILLKAAFGSEGVSAGTATIGTHTFLPLGTSRLPTFTAWISRVFEEFEYTALQLGKLTLEGKKGEAWRYTAEWVGRGEGTSLGTQSVSYGTVQPWAFSQTTLTIAGTAVANVDAFTLVIDRKVDKSHTLGTSRYPSKIWTEGCDVSGSFEAFYEDLAERNKFVGGSETSLNLVLSHDAEAAPSQKYRLEFNMPVVTYESLGAPQVDNPNGPFKASAAFVVPHAIGSTYGIVGSLVNRDTSVY